MYKHFRHPQKYHDLDWSLLADHVASTMNLYLQVRSERLARGAKPCSRLRHRPHVLVGGLELHEQTGLRLNDTRFMLLGSQMVKHNRSCHLAKMSKRIHCPRSEAEPHYGCLFSSKQATYNNRQKGDELTYQGGTWNDISQLRMSQHETTLAKLGCNICNDCHPLTTRPCSSKKQYEGVCIRPQG